MDFTHEDEDSGFIIGQNENGDLYITNLTITVGKHEVIFHTTYNSKSNYPLHVFHNDCEYLVFDENGDYTNEFISFCKKITL